MNIIHKGEHTKLGLIEENGKKYLRKSSSGDVGLKLMQEANFIENIIPDDARSFFPEILRIHRSNNDSEPSYFDMKYYKGRLLRSYLVDIDTPISRVVENIKSTLQVLRDKLHSNTTSTNPIEFAKTYYKERIIKRIEKFNTHAANILTVDKAMYKFKNGEVNKVFEDVISNNYIRLNSQKLKTPLEIVNSINLDDITPSKSSMVLIHGDPHFGNILIANQNPIFLDPNGFNNGGDLAYDLGKIILSLDLLDSIYEKKLSSPILKITEKDYIVSNLNSFLDTKTEQRIKHIKNMVVNVIIPEVFSNHIKQDINLLNRSIIVSSLHAMACAHTFISERPHISLHLLFYHLLKLNIIHDSPKL